jgi:hypothetical protein
VIGAVAKSRAQMAPRSLEQSIGAGMSPPDTNDAWLTQYSRSRAHDRGAVQRATQARQTWQRLRRHGDPRTWEQWCEIEGYADLITT